VRLKESSRSGLGPHIDLGCIVSIHPTPADALSALKESRLARWHGKNPDLKFQTSPNLNLIENFSWYDGDILTYQTKGDTL
jgi:hypothetical protein